MPTDIKLIHMSNCSMRKLLVMVLVLSSTKTLFLVLQVYWHFLLVPAFCIVKKVKSLFLLLVSGQHSLLKCYRERTLCVVKLGNIMFLQTTASARF